MPGVELNPPGTAFHVRFSNRPFGVKRFQTNPSRPLPEVSSALFHSPCVKSRLIHESVIKLFAAIPVGLFIFLFALEELSHVATDDNRMWRQSH
jgi:hypothetical protein